MGHGNNSRFIPSEKKHPKRFRTEEKQNLIYILKSSLWLDVEYTVEEKQAPKQKVFVAVLAKDDAASTRVAVVRGVGREEPASWIYVKAAR